MQIKVAALGHIKVNSVEPIHVNVMPTVKDQNIIIPVRGQIEDNSVKPT